MAKKINVKKYELKVKDLYWKCPLSLLRFKDTSKIKPLDSIIGQNRAIEALKLGLNINSPGYNIFVVGKPGTGRLTSVKHLLESINNNKPVPDDILYVHNFKDPDCPIALRMPAGKGKEFQNDMENLIKNLKHDIPKVFESEEYEKQKKALGEKYQSIEKETIRKFENKVKRAGLVVVKVQTDNYTRPDLYPVYKDKPMDWEEFENLTKKGEVPYSEFDKVRKKREKYLEEMDEIIKKTRNLHKELQKELRDLERNFVLPLVNEYIKELKQKYNYPKVDKYLSDVEEDIINNINRFLPPRPQQEQTSFWLSLFQSKDVYKVYKVNVVVDNSELKGAPVIIENTPTYRNIFGTIEKVIDKSGFFYSDFTKIKAGSLLKANGGYLVLNAFDALTEPGVWKALKIALRNKVFELQAYDPYAIITQTYLKPEPIKLDVKVIMIGDINIYYLLYFMDKDFRKIFKVKADFDTQMDRNKENIILYSKFVAKLVKEENLLHFSKSAVAKIIELGIKFSGRKNKLSTKFDLLSDIIREANYWAIQDKSELVEEKHVKKAYKMRCNRLKMLEDKLFELIKDNVLMLDVIGKKVGQINGLAVIDIGDYSFGKPNKITAKVSMGREGVVNIEREVELSGKIHNKGVLILTGFLKDKFAKNFPLTLSATICFEQSYSEVEGDSASLAETYALLSSIANIPLKQEIAVTGSLNQNGYVQPVGGINEKIEGFYNCCKLKGLTGSQGVIIPKANVDDLMLDEEVIEAVKNKQFHIYAIEHIDEGVEILTDLKPGFCRKDGTYTKDSFYHYVYKNLYNLTMNMKKFQAMEE